MREVRSGDLLLAFTDEPCTVTLGHVLHDHRRGELHSNGFFVEDNVRRDSFDPVIFTISRQHDLGRLDNVDSVSA